MGRSEVSQENLNKFLEVAEDLEIEGLQRNENIEDDLEVLINNQHTEAENNHYRQGTIITPDHDIKKDLAMYQEPDYDDLQKIEIVKGSDGFYSCDLCKYITKFACNLKTHKQGKHLGKRVNCNTCHREFYDKSTLQKHVLTKHVGMV